MRVIELREESVRERGGGRGGKKETGREREQKERGR